jgi:phosphoribosyl-ATP pyrophosphohydrolase
MGLGENEMNHKLEVLAGLAAGIAARRGASPESSYTAKLLSQGVSKCAKKFGEEAIEAAIAAAEGNKAQLTAETADVLYHLLVLLEASGVSLSDVMAELERRTGTSGIAEKAARNNS